MNETSKSLKPREYQEHDVDASGNIDTLMKDLRARRRLRSVNEKKDLSPNKPETTSKPETTTSMENLVKKRMEARRLKRALDSTHGSRHFSELRHRGEQSKTTRFDDTVHVATISAAKAKGEHGDETVRSLSPASTSRWKKISMNVSDIAKQSAGREAYNFFAATLSSPDDIAVPKESVESDAEKESDNEEQNAAEAETFHHESGDTIFSYPTYIPQEERLKSEAAIYFKANRIPTVADVQAVDDRAVEEGLYVGATPQVVPSNIWAFNDRMAHRTDKGQKWFEGDGIMHRQRNPLRILQTRPFINRDNTDFVEVVEAEVSDKMLASQSLDGISQLQIEIGSIQFFHHPLFSQEHILSKRVEQAYQSYSSQDSKTAEYYDKKLSALNDKVTTLKQKLTNIDPSDSNASKLRCDIISYLREVRDIRQKKRQLLEADYSLLKILLRHWKNLKTFRENQGSAYTPMSLTFKQLETDVTDEMAQMESDINAEVAELAELYSFERDQTMTSTPQNAGDGNIGNSDFNKNTAEENLHNYYSKHIRPPGEPRMIPMMANTHPVNQSTSDPLEELRRIDVDNTLVYAKIYLNDMEVALTKKRRLDQHFQVHFDETFIVEIFCLPESVRIEMFESIFVTSHLVAQVYLPIPQAQKAAGDVSWMDQYEFSSDRVAVYSHSGVGAGMPQDILQDKAILFTNGLLHATVFWEAQDKDAENLFAPHQNDRFKVWTREGVADSENVKKWIIQSKVDPNDPRNLDFFDLVDSTPSLCTEDAFRIFELEDVQRFSTDEFFEYDRRLTLLKLRDEGHHKLSGKPIPLYASEIPTSMWTDVVQSGANTENDLPLLSLGDFYSERQAAQNQFLLDIGEKVSQISSQRRDLVLSDIVVSDFIPNISSLKATLLHFLAPRRPLKPRRHAKKEVAHTSIVSTATIVVRVVRAYNVPLRMPSTSGHQSDQYSQGNQTPDFSRRPVVSDNFASSTVTTALTSGLVSPFVEVAYEDKILRTTTSSGANPSWNEDLSMSHDLLEKSFSSNRSTGTLHFSLFDEILVDILEDDRERATTIHQRIQKQFIGSFQIPLSTIRQRQTIEGTFQLDVPPLLLGYTIQSSHNAGREIADRSLRDSAKCQLQLFISLDPPLGLTSSLRDVLQSEEDHRHLEFTNQKLKTLQAKFPSRNIFSTALDRTGNLVFLSRYIHPQNPPLEVLQDANTLTQKMEFLARFVSLIPFFSESLQVTREYNAWITSDYFLQLLGGNVEQHAVLLCNYFLNCGVQAWVLLGHAIPEGKTAYVLTHSPLLEDVGYWIWNSSTGTHYYQNEQGIPLMSVGCIVNGTNIWANIQEHDHPSLVVFDTKNSKLWMPLLPSEVEWKTVQQDLVYSQTDAYKVKEIQQRFERSARDFIMKGRSRFVTKWNRHCTKSLQGILPSLENSSQTTSLSDHIQALNEVKSGYDLSGFPMNIRYSDADHLLEAIERTGIHLNESRNAEFGLAVHIHPYPNDILSLWVYIVCMIPK